MDILCDKKQMYLWKIIGNGLGVIFGKGDRGSWKWPRSGF